MEVNKGINPLNPDLRAFGVTKCLHKCEKFIQIEQPSVSLHYRRMSQLLQHVELHPDPLSIDRVFPDTKKVRERKTAKLIV
jgi:hypothetical protein